MFVCAPPAAMFGLQVVSGEARIGVYAREDIEPLTEVTYDYRYGTTDEDKFVPL